jgi:carboxyl-terminal processing protease
MRKVWIVIVGVALALGLVAGAFGSGYLVGRAVYGLDDSPSSVIIEEEPVGEPESPGKESPAGEDPEIVDGEDADAEPEIVIRDDEADVNFELIEDVLGILEREFYGEIPDRDTLAYGAIRGMLMTLDDPYTSFIEPDIAAILNEDATGEFEGIGATVQMREDGYLEVVRPLPGHPAEAAGIQTGDLIIGVDGESIVGYGLYEALNLIRGPRGTEVELEIARPGEADTFFVEITRARIELPVVEYEMLDDDVGYISLTEFDALASQRVEAALQDLEEQGMESLIFDLRDNPGGYLSQAIEVSDLFLDEGIVLIERDSAGNQREFTSYDGDRGEDVPLVLLINGGSASASEIVAGAIQARDRGALIGQTTLGKGSVQLPHDLGDGSQLRVTIARWFTPDDRSIHENGLEPAIEVPYPTDTPVDEDPQLERALEFLQEGE